MTGHTANIASLYDLHQLLHWPRQPDQPLRLIIAPAGDEFAISSETATTTVPLDADALSQMLKYYPAPVEINGAELPRQPFPTLPRVTKLDHHGNVTGLLRRKDSDHWPITKIPGQLFRYEGVVYHLPADLRPGQIPPYFPNRHPLQMTAELSWPAPAPQFSHWSRATRFRIEYNIDWPNPANPIGCLLAQNNHPICILTSADQTELRRQQERQEIALWQQVQATDPTDGSAAATYAAITARPSWSGWHADGEAPELYVNAPAQAAHIDIAASQQDCLGHTLAAALYANPDAGYVPVHSYPAWGKNRANPSERETPNLTVAGITIVDPDGQRLEYDPARNYGVATAEFWPEAIHRRAQSITIRVKVTAPDGTTNECVTPANAAFLGEYFDECIWLAEGYHGDVATLHDELFAAYWPFHDPPEELTADQYSDRMQALATRLLEGDRAAFLLEFQKLSRNFHPKSPPSAEPLAYAGARHRMIWLPKDGDAIGGAALAAVVSYCQRLSSEDAGGLAQQLREWLEITGRAAEMRGWLATARPEAVAADPSAGKVSETD